MKDEKMLKALEIDYNNDKINVDVNRLYSNTYIALTLFNLIGKLIKKVIDSEIEFEDGTKNLDYKFNKPLIWRE